MASKFVAQKIKDAADASRRGDAQATRRHLEHAVAEDPNGLKDLCDLADRMTGR